MEKATEVSSNNFIAERCVSKYSTGKVKAVLFDVYGTLIAIDQRSFIAEFCRILNVKKGVITSSVLRELVTTDFQSDIDFIIHWSRLAGNREPTSVQVEQIASALSAHLKNATLISGATTVLSYLKRKGFKLGAVSNLSMPYIAPFIDLGLSGYFDTVFFSCKENIMKPEPESYLRACRALAVAPHECLFLGDTKKTDFIGPISAGLRAILIGQSKLDCAIEKLTDVLWYDFDNLSPLIPNQIKFVSDKETNKINSVQEGYSERPTMPMTLPDERLGKYNVVGAIKISSEDGEVDCFVKRYQHPEVAYIEETVYSLLGLIGESYCRTFIYDDGEPILIMSKVHGEKWDASQITPQLASELGKWCAIGFIFGWADIRPRNALVNRSHSDEKLFMIDFEHCLFNLALVTDGIANPFNPYAIDALGEGEVNRRLKSSVVNSRHTKRARRSFMAENNLNSVLGETFSLGFCDVYHNFKRNADGIADLLISRIYREPFLIIGTNSYRRAMAKIDVDDILQRIREEPNVMLKNNF
ncbi:putative HAD family hydrolase [Azospirillaceae bacterium]